MPSSANPDNGKSVAAIFDFDGTITKADTFRDILVWQFGVARVSLGMLLTSPLIALYALGLLKNDIPKLALFSLFFRGWKAKEFQALCLRYAENRLPALIRDKALDKIHWHARQGHLLVIASASLSEWITPWATRHGFSHVAATHAEVDEDVLSGRFASPCVHGKEKVERLGTIGICSSNFIIHAYGDSQGDRELLAIADFPNFRSFQ